MTLIQETRLRDLKLFLLESDFKIIKCYEAQLLDEEMPYNFIELISLRRSWREELNLLEEEINNTDEE